MSSHAPYGRRWWALGVLGLSLFLISLDNTILNVALPTLQEDLSPSASGLQWIVDSYLLVFAGLLLVAGSLGDRFGRRRMLFAGLGIFGFGSVLAAMSGSAELLIASRALMGLGAAAIMPSTLSILTNTFPDRERAKAIAIWSGVAGLGVAFGPVVGGYLLKHFWWGSVFLVNVPFVVIAVAAGLWLVPESRDPRVSRLDPIGAVLSVLGLTTLVWAIIEAPGHGWTSTMVLGSFAAWELRVESPMLPLRFFRDRRFSAASISIALVFFSLFGVIFFLTVYLQSVLGYTALEAGIRTIPVSAALIVGSGLSTRLDKRLGTKVVVALGLAVVAAARPGEHRLGGQRHGLPGRRRPRRRDPGKRPFESVQFRYGRRGARAPGAGRTRRVRWPRRRCSGCGANRERRARRQREPRVRGRNVDRCVGRRRSRARRRSDRARGPSVAAARYRRRGRLAAREPRAGGGGCVTEAPTRGRA